jgi:hypothetical protein
MCEKDTAGRAGKTCEKRDLPDPNGTDLQTYQFDYLTSIPESASIGCGKRKQTSDKSAVGVFVGIVISGVIGLTIGYFVLYLLFPNHPFVKELATIFNSSSQAPVKKPQNPPPLPTPQPKGKQGDKQDHKEKPEEPRKENDPQPPPEFGQQKDEQEPVKPDVQEPVKPDVQKIVKPPPPKEIRQEITLDLSKPISRAIFEEHPAGNESIRVDITELGMQCEMKPANGIIRMGHPVDIVFKDYPDIIIRLSLPVRNNKIVVEAAPQVDLGKGPPIPLTQRWLNQYFSSVNKDFDKANQPLSEAKNAAQIIENWLNAPGDKPPKLKEANQQRLNVLKIQLIPTLEKQATAAQARVDAMQQLAKLVNQINGKAIHLIMCK